MTDYESIARKLEGLADDTRNEHARYREAMTYRDGRADGLEQAARTVLEMAESDAEPQSKSQVGAGIRRVWLIEAVDGSIAKPEWYESESDAREAAPDVTGHGDDWEACWRVTSFARHMESQSVAQADRDGTSTVDGVIYARTQNSTGDANYRNDGSTAAPTTEPQSVGRQISASDVKWVRNDIGELGVEVFGRPFFLYKGESLEYLPSDLHDSTCGPDLDGKPMRYRPVYKREFGEVCRPVFPPPKNLDTEGWREIPPKPVPATESKSKVPGMGLRAHLEMAIGLSLVNADPAVTDALRDVVAIMDGAPALECKSVADELAAAKRVIWKVRHIAREGFASTLLGEATAVALERIMRTVDDYGATRGLRDCDAPTMECRSVSLKYEDADWIRRALSALASHPFTEPGTVQRADLLAAEMERQLRAMDCGSVAGTEGA